MAINLELLDSFEFLSGDGIAFDPTTGNLFIAQTFVNSFFDPTFEADRAVFQVTSDGVEISNFTPEELRTAIGLSILPDGNLLISDVITGRILEYTPEGEIAPGGIDFAREEFGLDFDGDGAADPGDKSPPTGVAYNPDTETIFVLDSRGPQIFAFDTDGTLLSTLDLTGITPPGNGGPQGMAIDPLTGNFLIVNDGRTSNGEFASTLFEVSSDGELLSTTNLADLTGFIDAEGLTTDPETGELYVVFDNDSGSGDRVARLDILHAPELDRIKKSFNEDTPISFTSEDFSDAFSDVDGDELASITIETAPENGDLTLNGSRIRGGQTITAADLDNLVYTPDEDFFGLDTLEISASDGTKSSATATIDLLVNANEGLQFNLISSFAGGGDGVAYIPETGNIYAIDTEILGPGQFEWTVTEYTPEGEEVNEFTSEVFATALGGTALPNGNLLILSPRFGQLVEFTPEGEEVVGGINIESEALAVPNATLRGVVYDEATESIFVLDSAAIITNIDTEGNILSTLDFAESLPANQSVQGITIDPLTGNFLIVDQFDNGANNSIYEVTASGELVATTDLLALTGIDDPEGISLDPETRTVYVAFDDDGNNGSQIGIFSLEDAPELADISISGEEDAPISFTAEDFTDAFTDADDDELASITISSVPASGLLSLNGSPVREGDTINAADLGNLVYTPDPNFSGLDSFEVTASDGTGISEAATVNVLVNDSEGIELELLDSFEFLSGDGIAFDPTTGNLFIAQTFVNSFFNPTFEADRAVFQVTSDGVEISNFTPEELRTAIGLSILPDGNLLITDVITGRILEYTPEGEIAPGGIDFAREEFGLDFDGDGAADPGAKSPPTGVAYNLDTETIFVLDSRGPQIFEFDTDGTLLSTLDLTGVTPPGNGGPQGMAIDPLTGNFLIVNDGRPSNGEFASTLFEVSSDGELLSTTNLADLTGFIDAEGLTTDPNTGELYVVFDNDSGSGDRVARLDILHAPELTDISLSGVEDTPISFTAEDFADGFSDVDGDELASITVTSLPDSGLLTLNGSRVSEGQAIATADLDNLVYTPDDDFFGTDSFEFTASDGTRESDTATVNLQVNSNAGISLELLDSFEFLSGDGIAFDPTTGNLFIAQTFVNSFFNPTFEADRAVFQVTPEGDRLSSFIPEELRTAIGLSILPDGNLLISDVITGRILEYTPEGEIAPGGIDFAREEFGLDFDGDGAADPGDKSPPTGVAYNPDTETIFVLDSRGPQIFEFDTDGTLLSTLDLTGITPPGNGGPQGMAIDPLTGNFLIVNDGRTSNGEFASTLFEVSSEGELLSTTNLADLTGFIDAEGLTTDPETGELYVVFDNDSGSGDRVARLDILHAPELDRIKKSLNEDSPISFTTEDFADAFSDVDGDELASITIETAPENGDLTLNGSRVRGGQTITAADLDNLVYTPDEDFFGLDTLEISASDGTKSSATATIDLLVNANEGLQFNLISSFAGGGDGVAYIPETGNIYAIDTEILGPGQFEWTVTEYTPEGEEVNEFTSEVFATALGGTALPNGNLLILSPRFGELVEFTPDGEEVVGGIDIQNDALAVPNATLRGVAYDEATESIFVLDSAAIITNIDTEGNILSTLNFAESLPANQSVQGITIDPLTGNFLIVDQFDNGANNSIYEVTPSGELVATTDLLALTGIDDPEGISLDPETRTVYVAFDDDGNNGSQIGIFSLSPVSPLENAQGNPTGIFNFTGVDTNLVVSPVVNSSGEIQEVGVYTVDDEEGTIDGIAPGEDGYLEAAIERANVLFSLISDLPNGFDPSELQRVLDFDAGTNLGFLQVTNGTINSVQEDLATDGSTDAEVVLSTETDLETTLSSNGFTLNWNDEFSIQVEGKRAATVSVPVGTGLQNSQQLEVIDLRNETASSFQVDATLYREAALENFVGLYKIENTNGDVRDPVTGNLVNPGDDDYLEVALANRLPAFDYTVPNQTVATSSATLSGNDLIAPFIVAGDPVAPLLDGSDNEIPEVYFPFIGANPDGADHIRLIGDNAFVFEDLPNAGDSDFNDMILNLEFTAIA